MMIFASEFQLQESGKGSEDSAAACSKLRGDLRVIYDILPKDMQELLVMNPQTAALLDVPS